MSDSQSLYRSQNDRMIAGVCGGLSEYFAIDSSLVRFAFILIILLGGSGVLIYLILWAVLPEKVTNQSKGEVMIKDDKKTTSDAPHGASEKQSKHVWGMVLIGLGIVMLLQNFGFAHYLYLDKTWPAILIVLGLIVLSK